MRHVKTEPHYPYSEVYAVPDAPLSMVRLAIKLIDLLPHGSGIDCTWRIEAHANCVACHNDLHAMDQHGYYAGYYPFTVKFTAEELPEISQDYVIDCVNWAVEETYDDNESTINPWEEEGVMYNLRLAIFTNAYFDAIVFTDDEYWEKDAQFSAEFTEKVWSDCKSFLAEYGHMIATKDFYTAGKNFWLTRNRHGSGYWAYPEIYGDYTDALTNAAQTYPELTTYDQNGLIYFF